MVLSAPVEILFRRDNVMLDYKDIIIKHYGLGLSGREITKHLCISKSGANKFLTACKECRTLNFPLTDGITNYAIANHVCGDSQPSHARDEEFTSPNFENIHKNHCHLSALVSHHAASLL